MIRRLWKLNGRQVHVSFDPHCRLLDVLRDRLGLMGAKEGCGEGECGACSVIVQDTLVLSCLLLAASVPDSATILTPEGLSSLPLGRRLQKSFLASNAVQCGYCTPGMLMASHALLSSNPDPSPRQIREALSGNLCRCTGYEMIVEGVLAARPPREGDVD